MKHPSTSRTSTLKNDVDCNARDSHFEHCKDLPLASRAIEENVERPGFLEEPI